MTRKETHTSDYSVIQREAADLKANQFHFNDLTKKHTSSLSCSQLIKKSQVNSKEMPRPYFHKLILPNTIKEKKLRIPDEFTKKFGKDLATFVRFTVPGGHLWRIGLLKVDDKIWFHEHWQEFIERYAIRVGHFLIFRYEGNAVFHVHIFDLSASEIHYQAGGFSGKRSFIFEDMDDDDYLGHMISSTTLNFFNDSNKPVNCISSGAGNMLLPKGNSISQTNQLIRDVGYQNSLRNAVDDERYFGLDGETITPKPKKRGRKKKKVDPGADEQEMAPHNEDDGDGRLRFYESASVRKRTITAEERERAVNASKAFEPVNPFCRVVLRPSYLYRGCIMYLPSGFAEKHLNGVSGFIRLQYTDGKQWSVRCLYRGGRAKLSQGWYEFATENNMGEGDVCVFELLKSRDIILKVTVFRVAEESDYI